ncbi:uncharacterized protein VICG_01983 [Vittaforma corneae ATCC 50505]|uniref:Uncharacterized protein n=1 Tax=Vittaforma corneae (strain ATCC 50505) TaxID=993615 RepID=L2GJ97_VITCO|nr:uncharacterized protein VICG_01983 [Vittaforma corneae ATCC 50505]ELA40953.1 hypothetical protein VICG_01983 [Vittaforma corneae ATCC 50505]
MEMKFSSKHKKKSLLKSTLKFFHIAIFVAVTHKTDYFKLINFGFAEPTLYLFMLSMILGGMTVYSHIKTTFLWQFALAVSHRIKTNDLLVSTIVVSFLLATILIFLVLLLFTFTISFIMSRLLGNEVESDEFGSIAVSMTYLFMVVLLQYTVLCTEEAIQTLLNFILFNTALFLSNFLLQNFYISSFEMKGTKERFGVFLTIFLGFILTSILVGEVTVRNYILDKVVARMLFDSKLKK